MHEPIRGIALLQPPQQIDRARALVRPERGGVPFLRIAIGRRDEGWLAAHRETHIAGDEVGVHRGSAGEDHLPRLVGVGLGDAR